MNWVYLTDLSHELVHVPVRGDLQAAAVAEIEAHRATRDALTAVVLEEGY